MRRNVKLWRRAMGEWEDGGERGRGEKRSDACRELLRGAKRREQKRAREAYSRVVVRVSEWHGNGLRHCNVIRFKNFDVDAIRGGGRS